LFAQANYKEAAAGLYSVLSAGPGWDWTTLSSLYPSVDTYTAQLRTLEKTVKQNPKASDALLRKIGNYKFENFETIPLFGVPIEVVVDPKIIEDWAFSGWDGGDLGHTWLIKACKQEKPCK